MGEARREEPLVAGARTMPPANRDGREPRARRRAGQLPVAAIEPHPDQPRRHFDEDALDELAASIAQRGVIQPVIVRPLAGGRYQLVAGERRWRAAQKAQLHEIPALVRELERARGHGAGADREPPARGSQPGRGGARLQRLAELRGPAPGRDRPAGRQVAQPCRQPAAPAAAAGGGARTWSRRGGSNGPCPRADRPRRCRGAGAATRSTRSFRCARSRRLARRGRKRAGRRQPRPRRRAIRRRTPTSPRCRAISRNSSACRCRIAADTDPRSGAVTIRYRTLDQLDLICQRLTGGGI